jgi:hypothetical protein
MLDAPVDFRIWRGQSKPLNNAPNAASRYSRVAPGKSNGRIYDSPGLRGRLAYD